MRRVIRGLASVTFAMSLLVVLLPGGAAQAHHGSDWERCVFGPGYQTSACAWLKIDYTNHRVRPYGSVGTNNLNGYVSSIMRLFRNGYSVTRQDWIGTYNLDPVYTAVYDCGVGAGWRSYNTYLAEDPNGNFIEGTIYSDLAQSAC